MWGPMNPVPPRINTFKAAGPEPPGPSTPPGSETPVAAFDRHGAGHLAGQDSVARDDPAREVGGQALNVRLGGACTARDVDGGKAAQDVESGGRVDQVRVGACVVQGAGRDPAGRFVADPLRRAARGRRRPVRTGSGRLSRGLAN